MKKSLPIRAWFYVLSIILLGLSRGIYTLITFDISTLEAPNLNLIFSLLCALMTVAQLFKSEAPKHQLFHPNLMFSMAGVVLLPPALFFALIAISHLVEWAKERFLRSPHLKDWYIQPFNIATHTLIGFISKYAFESILGKNVDLSALSALPAFFVAVLIYTVLNHMLVGVALVVARGVSLSESEIMSFESLSTDFIMLTMGFPTALAMKINPWFFLAAIAPLILIYRSLSIPSLKKQASTDPKTGLWNADYFRRQLQVEFSRAQRNRRPLTLIIADLDLLRNINNVYGHLGGDAVLVGVAQILKASVREYDVVARFGGEEFAILMPETTPNIALGRVEEIRKKIEATDFINPINKVIIKATMSFGIAGLKPGDLDPFEILHRADMAVYEAKIKGRNRSQLYSRDFMENRQSFS